MTDHINDGHVATYDGAGKKEDFGIDVASVDLKGEVTEQRWGNETKRDLKGRHLSMLAVGGTIGYVIDELLCCDLGTSL